MSLAAPEREARRSDRAWSPYRRASGGLRPIVDEARCQAHHLEVRRAMRTRARKSAAAAAFVLSLEAILADMVHRVLTKGAQARIHLSLGNSDLKGFPRYRPAAVGIAVKHVLELLSCEEIGPWINLHLPAVAGERTSLSAGTRLLDRIQSAGISLGDIRTETEGEEVIVLRSPRDDDANPRNTSWSRSAAFMNYSDNETTNRMRSDMRAINAQLRKIAVEVLSEDGATWTSADMASIHLRRIFTAGSFGSGGRLWDATGAAFWYPMKNRKVLLKRIHRIRIDNEPVACVDIHAAALTCLYAMAGVLLPEGDLYVPPGYSRGRRADFKLATQCAIFCRRRRSTWPPDETTSLPAAEAFHALEQFHAPVAQFFWQGIGHQTQCMESDVLVHTLRENPHLRALPLHDAIIVPGSRAEEAREAFEEAFYQVTGGHCRATVELAD